MIGIEHFRGKLTTHTLHHTAGRTCDKCGCEIETAEASFPFKREGETFYFCSSSCRHEFAKVLEVVQGLTQRLWQSAALQLESPAVASSE